MTEIGSRQVIDVLLSDSTGAVQGSAGNPLNVTGSLSASFAAGFIVTGEASLAVSSSTANVALGSLGPVVKIYNPGTAIVNVKLGTSGVTAALTDTPILPGATEILNTNGTATYLAAIAASGTPTLIITTGTGSPSGWAGAGGGSSGALAAGTNIIGKVGIDQTTPGTTNKVSIGTDGTVGVTALPQATTKVLVTPTVTAATYAANKVIGGIMTFANVLPGTPFSAILESITLRFKGSLQTVGFYVAIFDTSPSGTFTDTNTAAIASGDTAYLVGIYHLQTPVSVLGTHTIFNMDGIAKAIQGASANLYVVVVPDATTAALGSTSDMSISLGTLWG